MERQVSTPSNKRILGILDKKLGFDETVWEIFKLFRIHHTLGLCLDRISRVKCEFSVVFWEPLTNCYDTVEGGVLMALDSAIWIACIADLGPEILRNNFLVTSKGSHNFIIPVEIKRRYTVISSCSGGLSVVKNRRVISGQASILDDNGREAVLLNATKVLKPCG